MSDHALRDITHPSPTRRGRAHKCPAPVPGRRLCQACLVRARTALRAIPPLYEDCAQAMSQAPRAHVRERVSGSRTAHTVNEAAVETRVRIQAVLASWAGVVVDERRLTARGDDVGRLAGFLADHLDWLAGHPGADDFVTEIDELVAAALRVIDTRPARGIELGSCVEPDCDGRLVARAPVRGAGAPHVGCDTGRHAWRPDQWLLLRHRLDRTGRA
jgi:hypothetical protein